MVDPTSDRFLGEPESLKSSVGSGSLKVSQGESEILSVETKILPWCVMEVLKPSICLSCREERTWISLNESSGSNYVATASRLQNGLLKSHEILFPVS